MPSLSRRAPSRAGRARAIFALGLLLTFVTDCRDASGPSLRYARVAVAPIFPANAQVAAFGLAIDRVRLVVARPSVPPDTLADTSVSLPPDADVLDLDLRVPIVTSPETLTVSIIALSGTIPLFEGTSPVEVSAGLVTEPTEIPVDNYVGPGSGVDSIAITPRTSFIYFGDSLRYQVQAFQGGTPVTQFYVSWTTSDTALAKVNGTGTLKAPSSRTAVWVKARTPGGISDSVRAAFQPVPSQVVLLTGGGQSGTVGLPLATPLQVEVRAADNFPVAGAAVRFRAPSGGAPADTTVIADSLGHATVNAVLGSGVGAQTFQITLPAFPSVPVLNVGATAVGTISASQSVVTTSAGTVRSGSGITLTLRGKDAAGSNVSAGGAGVVFTFSGGASTGTISPTTDHGDGTYTAVFTGVLAGAATTIGATINGTAVTTSLPAVSVTPGVIAAAASVITVSPATIPSGDSATLTLQAKDAAGNAITAGGDTVSFSVSGGGGVSTGTIGTTTDHGNGTYTAKFSGVLAGTAATIGATINGTLVTSAPRTITVTPGALSPATSVLSVSSTTIASGASATITLQGKDAVGNNLTSGGATVTFVDSGGTSTGSIGVTTDHANGTYTALFTGTVAGTGTTIKARIGGAPVPSTASITVVPGNSTAAQSIISVSVDSVSSGSTVTLTLRVRDSLGNNIGTGGSTVIFNFSGGISTGTIAPSPATDNGNGTYTAILTGVIAGTPSTVGATLDGASVTSTLPTVKVLPGAISAATSVVTVSNATITSGALATLGLRAKDAVGNNLTTGGAAVAFTFSGGASTGTIGVTVDSGNGKYTAPFTGVIAGSATTIGATVNGTPVGTPLPTIVVTPGATASVTVLPSADTIAALGLTRQFGAQAHDANGNLVSDTFTWSSSSLAIAPVDGTGKATAAGNGTATITATAASNGKTGNATLVVTQIVTRVSVTPAVDTLGAVGLTAQFTAKAFDASDSLVPGKTFAWTSSNALIATVSPTGLATAVGVGVDTIRATGDGVTGVAVLTIVSAVHATDITIDETWSAAASPHVVSGYLRVINGATLTIQDGATVKFDAGAGLQIGDTTLNQAGALVMLGTPSSIHLTANTGTPVAGFWKGLEVQKAGAPLAWRNVDIEYAGGTRPNLIDEACVLLVDPAASVELDSVHIRQCVHSGVNQFAGNLHVHRSEVDTVTGAGIAAFAGTLRLDSTAIRGSGQMGLILGNGLVNLAGSVANKFTGNSGGSVQMFGRQLPGFGRQDSIAGNGVAGGGVGDTILVDIDSGAVGTAVPAFTISRQPAPYLVTGFLSVWSPTGVNVSLDTGLVMAFDTAAAFGVGDFTDSSGASSGVSGNLVSLGTAAQPVVLRNREGRPGWEGLFLGAQSGAPVVRHIRLAKGGYQPNLGQICQNCIVKTTGLPEILNATLWVDAPNGTAPFDIDSVTSDSSHYHGIVVKRAPPQGVRVRDNIIRGAAVTGLVMRERYNAQDVISGNTITGNHNAVDVAADELPQFDAGVNTLAGNVSDTLLLHGGTLAVSDTLPQLGGGFRWRVTQGVVVDSGATFTVLAGDTVVFDDLASLTIGGGAPSGFHAAGTAGAPILFTVTPGGDHWLGLDFANLGGPPSIVSNLIVEKAGGSVPCFGDCLPILFGAIRYSNVSTTGLTLDAVTVRQSRFMALDVQSTAASPVLVQNSQFYENPASPMITSPNPLLLAIHGSDLYHYNGQIIQTANAGTDSIDALGNWWGDVGGLERGFQASDSAGMGTLSFNAVRFDAVVPGPHFPVGPAAQIVPATDTVLANGALMNAIVGDPDSIRVRVLDAQSRGVAGVTIGWGTSTGVFSHPGTPTDAGGRAAGVWQTTNAANLQFVQATVGGLIGSPVTFTAFIQPGLTVAHDFLLDPALTQGSVSADHKTVTFSASGHHGVLVSHALDAFGNVTHPTTNPDFCFDDVPATGFCHNQFWYAPQYGIIDSVKADSVFFTVTTTSPAQFQIRAQYDGATGPIVDSVFISMNAIAAGVRIIDPSFNTNADTALYNSLCPVGGPYNALCRRTFMAQLVDSGGAALPPNAAYQFSWTNPLGGPTISDSSYGTMNEFGVITAHQNGSASMIVQQIAGPPLSPDRDTLAITVNQVIGNIAVTPDTISAGLGDTVTFSATPTDQGGSAMPGVVGWRQDQQAGQYLTVIDYPTASSIRVRIDSGYPNGLRDVAVITAFTERAPGDTILAAGVIYNPTIRSLNGLGSQPWGVGIDPRTERAYVSNRGSRQVAVVDVRNNVPLNFVDVGTNPERVMVDSRNARVYVTNVFDNTISVLDGANNGALLSTMTLGPSVGFTAADTSSNLVFIPSACADPPVCSRGGSYLHKIDGASRSFISQDTVQLPANGTGLVFDELNRRVYVAMANDTVAIVDPAANKVVGLIGVGVAPQGMAINPLTRKLYVANMGDQTVSVIDLSSNSLVKNEFVSSNQPQRVAVDPIKNRIYVAGYGNFLVDRIDGNTDTNIGYLSVNCAYPNDVAVNPLNRDLFMPCWSDGLFLTYRYLTH